MQRRLIMNLFVRKTADIFVTLYETQGMSYMVAYHKLDCQYPYMVKTIKNFERLGFITIHKSGRNSVVRMTETGAELYKAMKIVVECAKNEEFHDLPKSAFKDAKTDEPPQ